MPAIDLRSTEIFAPRDNAPEPLTRRSESAGGFADILHATLDGGDRAAPEDTEAPRDPPRHEKPPQTSTRPAATRDSPDELEREPADAVETHASDEAAPLPAQQAAEAPPDRPLQAPTPVPTEAGEGGLRPQLPSAGLLAPVDSSVPPRPGAAPPLPDGLGQPSPAPAVTAHGDAAAALAADAAAPLLPNARGEPRSTMPVQAPPLAPAQDSALTAAQPNPATIVAAPSPGGAATPPADDRAAAAIASALAIPPRSPIAAPPSEELPDAAALMLIQAAPGERARLPAAQTVSAILLDSSASEMPADAAGDQPLRGRGESPARALGALAPATGFAAQAGAQQSNTTQPATPQPVIAPTALDGAKSMPATGKDAAETSKPNIGPELRAEPFTVADPSLRGSAMSADVASATARVARASMHPVVIQVAAHIAQAVIDSQDRISIRLSPADLGRIDVKLDFGPDGRVQAVFAADRAQTVDLLQRDARDLERALQDAGLRADSGSLTFNLRGEQRDGAAGSGGLAREPERDAPTADLPAAQLQAYSSGSAAGRIDIRV